MYTDILDRKKYTLNIYILLHIMSLNGDFE